MSEDTMIHPDSSIVIEPSVRLSKVRVEFPFHKDAARGLRTVRTGEGTANGNHVESGAGARFRTDGRKTYAAALDDIDLHVRSGDRLGLMGHNGAGKSTLIRVISGLLQPSSGSMVTVGRVASTISTTFGFDMALSGRENVTRRGLMMRMSADEIRRHTEDIVEFAELGRYIDMPMGTYSSGMKARLGFAITTSADADILVMDEWIGAGDPRFIEKCEARLADMVDRSRILILATHKEQLLRRVCNRFAILEKGRLREVEADGGPEVPPPAKTESVADKLKARAEKYRQTAVSRAQRLNKATERITKLEKVAAVHDGTARRLAANSVLGPEEAAIKIAELEEKAERHFEVATGRADDIETLKRQLAEQVEKTRNQREVFEERREKLKDSLAKRTAEADAWRTKGRKLEGKIDGYRKRVKTLKAKVERLSPGNLDTEDRPKGG